MFMKEKAFYILIIIIGLAFMFNGAFGIFRTFEKERKQEEYIKQLEQSLAEQIQETEIYRDILKTYQEEGILNE